MMRLPINIKQDKSTCQEPQQNSSVEKRVKSETALQAGQKVCLYGDIEYKGILIRPLERTYPQKWTVELKRGGFEAANVEEISPLESLQIEATETDLPFSDKPEHTVLPNQTTKTDKIAELKQRIRNLEHTVRELEVENQIIKQQYQEIERENERLKQELKEARQTIRYAQNISPILRPSLKRVLRLAHDACMDVKKTVGGWILYMGDKARKFRRLMDIWQILAVDDFFLNDIFPEDKLIPLDKIKPIKRKEKPEPPEKITFPSMHPKDIMRNPTKRFETQSAK